MTTLLYGKETVVLDEVTSAFLSHVKMKQDGNGSQADGIVVKSELSKRGRSESRFNGNRSQSISRAKKDVKCFYCHKKGHYKNQCEELKGHLELRINSVKIFRLFYIKNLFFLSYTITFPKHTH